MLAQRAARLEQAIELAALDEDRRLGRVQVLRLAAVEHAAAEADDLALDRADRKHDAIAEAVVALLLGPFVALHDDHAALGQQRIVVAREHAGQAAPARRRVAQAEALGDLAAQAAALEVVDGLRVLLELAAVVLRGALQHLAQRGLVRSGLQRALLLAGSIGPSGTAMPTCCARSATASRKLMPECSIRKRMASPCAPQPKQ